MRDALAINVVFLNSMKHKAEFYYALSLLASFAAVIGAREGLQIAPWIMFTAATFSLLAGIMFEKSRSQ